MADDGVKHETIVLFPGSSVFLFQDGNVDLYSLFEYFPPSLFFFMARRLFQFNKVELAYDCFAEMEKHVTAARKHIHRHLNLFDGVKIDLPPMLLSVFVGHRVGYMESLPSRFYAFGIDILG